MIVIVFLTRRKSAFGIDGSASLDRYNTMDLDTGECTPPVFWEVQKTGSIAYPDDLVLIGSIHPGNDRHVSYQHCQQTFGYVDVTHTEDSPENTLDSAQKTYSRWVESGMPAMRKW